MLKEEEGKADVEDEHDLKNAMKLSFATYYMLRSSILTLMSKTSIQVPLIISHATEKMIASMSSEKVSLSDHFKINYSNNRKIIAEVSIEKMRNKVDSDVVKLNSQIKVFNSKFGTNIEELDIKVIEQLKTFETEIENKLAEADAEIDLVKDPLENETARAYAMISVLEEISQNISEFKLSTTIANSVKETNNIVLNDLKELNLLTDIIKENGEKLSKFGIGMDTIDKIKENKAAYEESLDALIKSEDKISSYTNNINDLQSRIDKNSKEIEDKEKDSKDSDTDAIEIPEEKLEDDKE